MAILCNGVGDPSSEKHSLWKKIIRGKFGEEKGGYGSIAVRDSYGVEFWKEIGKR
ncbi:hypothetical protein CK203_020488 [Vitis vinifera]|uniref:Uncharacterized protein n=1 Tax=Vitis vinifera TaxID=29760 RepID=A0A438FMV8_VITVI|nr:hypothetical protein CK203_020488 [Vitis vinifera]